MGSTQPSHRLVQLSDFHFTEGNELLFDLVDTEQQLRRAFDRLADSGQRFDAVIISGDLADAGSAEAYQRLAGLVAE